VTVDVLRSLLLILLILVPAGLVQVWYFRRAASLLSEWAERECLHLVSREQRWLRQGPFFWTSSNWQAIYRVTARDRAGNLRQGWVRCGSWLFGVLSQDVEVRWD
jgi:hypothetical protein